MQLYAILRRNGWATGADLEAAAARSTVEGDAMPDDIRWIRSYVLAETDGSLGTVCIYEASGPKAIREHAERVGMGADEIIPIAAACDREPSIPRRASSHAQGQDRGDRDRPLGIRKSRRRSRPECETQPRSNWQRRPFAEGTARGDAWGDLASFRGAAGEP